jgi:hypothetical protein
VVNLSTLHIGDSVETISPLVLKSFSITNSTATLEGTEKLKGKQYIFPLSCKFLGVGDWGVESFCPPDQLPYDHPHHIYAYGNVFLHRRTGEKVELITEEFGKKSFAVTGMYTLRSMNGGDPLNLVAPMWSHNTLRAYLEDLKGKIFPSISGRVAALYFLETEQFEQSVTISAVSLHKKLMVFVKLGRTLYSFSSQDIQIRR